MIKYGIKKPTEDTPQGMEDCKNYANEKLEKVNESLEEVIKTL